MFILKELVAMHQERGITYLHPTRFVAKKGTYQHIYGVINKTILEKELLIWLIVSCTNEDPHKLYVDCSVTELCHDHMVSLSQLSNAGCVDGYLKLLEYCLTTERSSTSHKGPKFATL